MPRARSSATTFSARSAGTSGMMRGAASTMTKCRSETERRSLRSTATRAMSSSSEMVSTPAKPPPTMTKVRARRRASASLSMDATSMRSRTQLRTETASSMVFRPIATSARPGIGNARVTAPAPRTISSYFSSKGSPLSVGSTIAVRFAWSMERTRPGISSVSRRCWRSGTVALRPSMEPAATSGRKGW
ncbi:Uncharacterised protein [Mycobacterium tuberculosis]|nr:Uncharacterised protein [Mycobacterium tuberculosis]